MSSEQEPIPDKFALVHVSRPFRYVRFALISVVVVYFCYGFTAQFLMRIVQWIGLDNEIMWVQGASQLLFMLVPVLVLMQYSSLRSRDLTRADGDVSTEQWVLGLAGILPILLFNGGWTIIQEALLPDSWLLMYREFQQSVNSDYQSLLIGRTIPALVGAYLVGAVIPAFVEEYFFRGLIQRSFEEVWTPMRSIVTTGLIFGIIHFNPAGTVTLILIGIYLGILAWYTRSLALPIAAHFFNNAISITMLNLVGDSPPAAEQASIWQGIFIAVIALAMLVLILMRLFSTRRLIRTPHWEVR